VLPTTRDEVADVTAIDFSVTAFTVTVTLEVVVVFAAFVTVRV
jgi:hypothetical protein